MANRSEMERNPSASTVGDGAEEFQDLDRLRAEIEQENDIFGMVESSVGDLQGTIIELERRYELANEEDNEWKTRCETQEELNQLLNKQIEYLRDRLDQSRDSAKDSYESDLRSYDELSEGSLRKLLKQIEREKQSLESQLRDYDWRLDQESKAFHKANDERKNLHTELLQAKLKLEELKVSTAAGSQQKKRPNQRGGRAVEENVPDNQRILDPKHGPIRKTAAVKKLPKLDA